jgi:hypothetical protein
MKLGGTLPTRNMSLSQPQGRCTLARRKVHIPGIFADSIIHQLDLIRYGIKLSVFTPADYYLPQTVAAIASCVLGLLTHPNVLKKAQQEIDSVVKPGQLPDFDDEDSLPYITAIVKETLRWEDVVPIGEKVS